MPALARAKASILVAAIVALLAAGCPGVEDEASIRRREAAEIEGRKSSFKVTLYRVAKTSVRSLPPRGRVRALVHGKESLTREEWAALLETDPVLAGHRSRTGVFVTGCRLREAAYSGALAGAAILAARGGGHLAGDIVDPPFAVPRTESPFGSPVVFYRECKEMLADDEDRYPTLFVAMLPEALHEAARERRDAFAKAPFDRVAMPAFEHLALGAAWAAVEPDLALYELLRARVEGLSPLEEAVVRAGRTLLFMKARWSYHALDELDALERRLPEVASATAAIDLALSRGEAPRVAGARPIRPGEVEAVLAGLVHVLRHECYLALGRPEDAARELELAEARLKDQERLRAVAHLLAAKVLLDEGKYKEAAGRLRLAADAIPGDLASQAEMRALAERLERELPESDSALDLARFAGRQVYEEARRLAVGDEVRRWSEQLRERTREQVEEWERAFPSTDDLRESAQELWKRVGR